MEGESAERRGKRGGDCERESVEKKDCKGECREEGL